MTVFQMNKAIDVAFSMAKYAIYLRKSRADMEAEKLGEGETLARHKKILTELAARQGLYIGEIYQEIVSGADSINDRPEIKRLIQDCYAGKWAGILVVEVSRFSRGSQGDAQIIMDCLKYANMNQGLLVITPTKVYDVANNSDDEEYMEFELFMSRREYKMIKRRMDRGKDQAIIDGEYMGAYRPYGWDILKTKAGRTLQPNEEEFGWLKRMYTWAYNENMSPGQIARKLTALGIPTYTGETEWSRSSVKDILLNPVNVGKVRWNTRMKIKTMIDGKLVSSRPRSMESEKFMLYDGKHKKFAPIDQETFDAVTNRFYADRTKANYKLQNPLAGLLLCQNCQKMMVYQAYKNKPNVQPRFCHKESKQCKVKSVLASDVMEAVVHALKLYIEDFEEKLSDISEVDENSLKNEICALEKELNKTEKKLAKAFDDYEEGIYTANEFIIRKEKHNARIEVIKNQIEELENSIPEKEEYQEKVYTFSEALDALLDDNIDADLKNEFLKRIIAKIEFSRENETEFVLDVFLR